MANTFEALQKAEKEKKALLAKRTNNSHIKNSINFL